MSPTQLSTLFILSATLSCVQDPPKVPSDASTDASISDSSADGGCSSGTIELEYRIGAKAPTHLCVPLVGGVIDQHYESRSEPNMCVPLDVRVYSVPVGLTSFHFGSQGEPFLSPGMYTFSIAVFSQNNLEFCGDLQRSCRFVGNGCRVEVSRAGRPGTEVEGHLQAPCTAVDTESALPESQRTITIDRMHVVGQLGQTPERSAGYDGSVPLCEW